MNDPYVQRDVSGRFLADVFRILEMKGIAVSPLLGDLPITRTDEGGVSGNVDWNEFAEFIRRLGLQVGGESGLEALGAEIGHTKPAAAMRALVGLSGSARMLYLAAIRWALPRALPMVKAYSEVTQDPAGNDTENHLKLVVETSEWLRPCPELLHLASGAIRALPGLLELPDAVVSTSIGLHRAEYDIVLPPARSFFANARRVLRTLFSAGSVLQFLEQQQLELHARHSELERAHEALARSEAQHRALTDAAVDVLLEIDDEGKILHASASIERLIGYTRDQVTGSHFSLWMPRHAQATAREIFKELCEQPAGALRFSEIVPLVGAEEKGLRGELSVRSYLNGAGELRFACVLRDLRNRSAQAHRHEHGQALSGTRNAEQRADAMREAASPEPLDRIVHVAVAAGDGEHGTTETHKLIDAIATDFAADEATEHVELRFNTSRCPSELPANAQLLRIALGNLVEFVGRSAPGAPLIEVGLVAQNFMDRGPRRRAPIEIRVEARAKGDWDPALPAADWALNAPSTAATPNRDAAEPRSVDHRESQAALALTVAREAATAMGAHIEIEDPESLRVRLSLPQPEAR